MFRNYLTIAIRNIWKTKLHSLITISGLAAGIACCIFIILFVKDEWTFDAFHTKADRIYRAWVFEDYGPDEQFFNTTTPFPLGPALKESFSEVSTAINYYQVNLSVKSGIDTYTQNIKVTSTDFFDVFDFQQVEGKLSGALEEKLNTVVTTSTAEKFFGTTNAVGETIEVDFGSEKRTYTVRAVVEDPPTNSSLQFEMIISDLNNDILISERALSSWYNVSGETYVVLQPGTNLEQLSTRFDEMLQRVLGENYEEGTYTIGLQPLLDIHLNTEMPTGMAPVSDPKYALILAAIALLILLLASINFVTLSIARSVKRYKEVGVRKVVGARKQQLITQFLSEAVVKTFLATLIGLGLAYLLLPYFNELAGKQLVLTISPFTLSVVVGLLLLIGVVAGSYPALVLSRFQPVAIFKGLGSSGSKSGLRKVLVGTQFVLTIFLISTTLLMKQQLDFLRNKNLGYNKDQVIITQLSADGDGLMDRINNGFERGQLMVNELKGKSGIQELTMANHTFGIGGWTNIGYTDINDNYRTLDVLVVDASFIPAMEIEMTQGRNFSDDNLSDERRALIINESFAKEYGWESAVGKQLPGANFEDHEIIGVVKDFNYTSLHGDVQPLAIVLNPNVIAAGIENIGIGSNPMPKLWVRVNPDQLQEGLASVKTAWEKVMGDEEFDYSFLDQTLAAQYEQDQNLGEIVSVATILALIIGCMGLFALASLNMANRTKEISIRKVLGASRANLLLILTKEYVVIIVIALVISVPATLYVMSVWLEGFAYRISPGAEVFALTGILVLFVALITISYHALSTAKKQPAETLKYE